MVFSISFATAMTQVWKLPIEDLIIPFLCGFTGAFADFTAADSIAGTGAFKGKAKLVIIITAILALYGLTSRIGITPCLSV